MEQHLNDEQFAEVLLGNGADPHPAQCESCSAEASNLVRMTDALRQDLQSRSDMPGYFWSRQQARIREQLIQHTSPVRWAAVAVIAVILVAFALITHGMQPELAQRSGNLSTAETANGDDALLEDIQASLQRPVPKPFMPATLLVQAVSSGHTQNSDLKEN